MPKILSPAEIESFRERLCDVAEQQFADHGPDGVTLRQLADALGVSSMTPYRYFKDKDAILAAVRARAFTRFAEAMEKARKTYETGKSKQGTLGEAYVDFAVANPASYRMMFDVYQPTFEAYPDLTAAMDRAKATMGNTTLHLPPNTGFEGGSELAAHMFWAMLHGAVMLQLANLLRGDPSIDARSIVRAAMEVMGKGLGLQRP